MAGMCPSGSDRLETSYAELMRVMGIGASSVNRRLSGLARQSLNQWQARDGKVTILFRDPAMLTPPDRKTTTHGPRRVVGGEPNGQLFDDERPTVRILSQLDDPEPVPDVSAQTEPVPDARAQTEPVPDVQGEYSWDAKPLTDSETIQRRDAEIRRLEKLEGASGTGSGSAPHGSIEKRMRIPSPHRSIDTMDHGGNSGRLADTIPEALREAVKSTPAEDRAKLVADIVNAVRDSSMHESIPGRVADLVLKGEIDLQDLREKLRGITEGRRSQSIKKPGAVLLAWARTHPGWCEPRSRSP